MFLIEDFSMLLEHLYKCAELLLEEGVNLPSLPPEEIVPFLESLIYHAMNMGSLYFVYFLVELSELFPFI